MPDNTENDVEAAYIPANGTDTFKMQRLEGTMNHKSERVVLQLITDSRKWVLLTPFFDCLKTVTPES
jgi:hypothetical protein